MQDGSCSALPVLCHTDEYGDWTCSFWKPNIEELKILNEGGCIRLEVRACGPHPVVAVGVSFPLTL